MRRTSRSTAVLTAVLLSAALLAAACSSSDDSGGSAGSSTSGASGAPASGASGNGNGAGANGEDARAGNDKPAEGGHLVYGLEADSANPWAPYGVSCAISCYEVLNTVTDPLFVANQDGKVMPYILASATPSADYKSWTFTARDGITFHDGTPFDGAAIKYNIDTCRASTLTGPAFAPVTATTASGQSATLTLSLPMGSLPGSFLLQCGYMFSPKWLKSLPTNPLRKGPLADPDTVAAPATGKEAEPVGLGAFVYKSYTPGNGNSFVATKNPNYWRRSEGLPHLDEVELVVAVDIQSRSNGLRSGQFDIMHTANGDEISNFRGDKDVFMLEASAFGQTGYIMLNVAAGTNPTYAALSGKDGTMDPKGANASSPLLEISCRKALAEAIDLDRYTSERDAKVLPPANGPFPAGSMGHLDDTGYPRYDLVAARADMDTCLAKIGKPAAEFTFNTTNDPYNVESNQLIISMWQEAFGNKVKTTVTPVEQGQYIGLALAGTFNAFGWRNHGGVDPDQQFNWWFSGTASPIGQLALNFGRFMDPDIDKALLVERTNPDPAAREAAMEAINRTFGKQVYNLWLDWTVWGIVANPKVRNLTDLPLPGGGVSFPVVSGEHSLSQIWCQGGDCG